MTFTRAVRVGDGRDPEIAVADAPVPCPATAFQAQLLDHLDQRRDGIRQAGFLQVADQLGGQAMPLGDLRIGLEVLQPGRQLGDPAVELDELRRAPARRCPGAARRAEPGEQLEPPRELLRLAARLRLLAAARRARRSAPCARRRGWPRPRRGPLGSARPTVPRRAGSRPSAIAPGSWPPPPAARAARPRPDRRQRCREPLPLPLPFRPCRRRRRAANPRWGAGHLAQLGLAVGQLIGQVAGHRQLLGDVAGELALDLAGQLVEHRGARLGGLGRLLGVAAGQVAPTPSRPSRPPWPSGPWRGPRRASSFFSFSSSSRALSAIFSCRSAASRRLSFFGSPACPHRPARLSRRLALALACAPSLSSFGARRPSGVVLLFAARPSRHPPRQPLGPWPLGLAIRLLHHEAGQGRVDEVFVLGELLDFLGDLLGLFLVFLGLADLLGLHAVEAAHRPAALGVVGRSRPGAYRGPRSGGEGRRPCAGARLVLAVIERRDGGQHRLLGRVQRLDPLTDDPLDSLGELAGQLGERLLEAGDLERVVGDGLVGRLVLRQPRRPGSG